MVKSKENMWQNGQNVKSLNKDLELLKLSVVEIHNIVIR